jgi:hydroxymethylbilane synthase
VPDGLLAVRLKVEEMLPCIGQAALGIEIRADDERMASICERLNHFKTYQCASAERAFLRGMGGGCQTPVAAYAESVGHHIRMRAVSFIGAKAKRAEGKRPIREAEALGEQLAGELRA